LRGGTHHASPTSEPLSVFLRNVQPEFLVQQFRVGLHLQARLDIVSSCWPKIFRSASISAFIRSRTASPRSAQFAALITVQREPDRHVLRQLSSIGLSGLVVWRLSRQARQRLLQRPPALVPAKVEKPRLESGGVHARIRILAGFPKLREKSNH